MRIQRAQDHRKRSPDAKDMPVFVLRFLQFSVGRKFRPCGQKFRPREEIPAPGSSGPSTGISGPFFHLSFLAKSFWLFSLEGVRNFRSLVRNIRPKENLAKSFSRFISRVGVRNFAPEVCSGNFRGTGNSGVSPGISAPRLEFPAL